MIRKITFISVFILFLLLSSCTQYYSLTLNGEWTILHTIAVDSVTQDDSRAGEMVFFNYPVMEERTSDGEIFVSGVMSELTAESFMRVADSNGVISYCPYTIIGDNLEILFYAQDKIEYFGKIVCTK
jgi:hypothetical protein